MALSRPLEGELRILYEIIGGAASIAAAIIIFFLLSAGLFRNTFLPALGFLWLMSNDESLAKAYASLATILGITAAYISVKLARRRGMNWKFSAPAFVSIFVIVTWLMLTVSLEVARRVAIAKFDADASSQHSVLWSYHRALEPFKTHPHAAALKDCRIYIWSYKSMSFIELSPDAYKRAAPNAWVKSCTQTTD